MYEYKAIVKKVVDGDTMVLDVDLGLGVVLKNVHARLLGVNAPESRLSAGNSANYIAGLKTKEFVKKVLVPGCEVVICTALDKRGKYGRLLVRLFYSKATLSGVLRLKTYDVQQLCCLNEELLTLGLAKLYADKI